MTFDINNIQELLQYEEEPFYRKEETNVHAIVRKCGYTILCFIVSIICIIICIVIGVFI